MDGAGGGGLGYGKGKDNFDAPSRNLKQSTLISGIPPYLEL